MNDGCDRTIGHRRSPSRAVDAACGSARGHETYARDRVTRRIIGNPSNVIGREPGPPLDLRRLGQQGLTAVANFLQCEIHLGRVCCAKPGLLFADRRSTFRHPRQTRGDCHIDGLAGDRRFAVQQAESGRGSESRRLQSHRSVSIKPVAAPRAKHDAVPTRARRKRLRMNVTPHSDSSTPTTTG